MALEDIISERKKKADLLKKEGINPYPAVSKRTAPISQVIIDWKKYTGKRVNITGRVFAIRGQGGVLFLDIKDEHEKLQAVLRKNTTKNFDLVENTLDIGDFVQVTGKPMLTKRGEKSIDTRELTLLTKSLRPIPKERFAVKDEETRLRQRYLDILLNPEVKETFYMKSRFWSTIRNHLTQEGFLEVETPVLENITGGAEARPFITHHNALDIPMYLRISLELPLKRLLVAGYEKVFEIGRIFRNEGIDADHLQDYTQLEFYWAYADYTQLMKFTEKLYKKTIKETLGTLKHTYQGNTIDWSKKWKTVDYCNEFEKVNKLDPRTATVTQLRALAKSLKVDFDNTQGKGRLIDLIFKKTIRTKLIQPCFLINPPIEIEPLAKKYRDNPLQVERFQIVAGGSELGKGFSELNDPVDQRERFEAQNSLREHGDDEAQMMDQDFLIALEHGMPPAAGFGLSERLFAVLLDKPIRETVFFPNLRPK
ncbi:MAG: lysine--tRNA ligase [Candidatus Harrisonbacteria bacterium CG10_big_fil_rev_8_21_14_0_10_38_8]|uniref:Lysine--tRNA ligase n=1 Tax=Candidatus Harrisonbacteria bacterium CG10_big_fil_rev_8_21_14_0_10_38_8 TaxID=1974582 RepID=A0A2M6WKL1_9BACT|nr:MAG: lysine--tRNA ligase [Candidatus Harrisonbacteria bacterium CG10_big_fil_rev_8_21_14_0_10_38_8]